jgi:site-specific DNA recombinase
MTKREVWDHVTTLGLKTKSGKPLSIQQFGYMLRNPIYIGRVVSKTWNHEGEGDFEPTISTDLFAAVQAVSNGKKRIADRRKRDNPEFPLRRIVKCGECRTSVTGSRSTGSGGSYAYYRCPKKGCGYVSVPKRNFELQLVAWLESQSVRSEVLELLAAVVKDAWHERGKHLRDTHAQLVRRQDELDLRRDRLVDAFVQERSINQATYDRQCDRLDREQERIQSGLEQCRPLELDPTETLRFAELLLTDLSGCWNRLEWHQKPDFLRALYPSGLLWSDGAFGTIENSWLMASFGFSTTGDESLAPPTGFEPVLPP